MKKINFYVLVIILLITISFSSSINQNISSIKDRYTGIEYTFNNVQIIKYQDKPAASVDITIYDNSSISAQDVGLSRFALIVLVNKNGKIMEKAIPVYKYKSSVLAKTVRVSINGDFVCLGNNKIPDIIKDYMLGMNTTDRASILFLLPDSEWFCLYKIGILDYPRFNILLNKIDGLFLNIFSENKYININNYTTKNIINVFQQYNIMTPNLNKLLIIYEKIQEFEDINKSYKQK